MAPRLSKTVRELVDTAEEIGWSFSGEYDGNGHPVLVHASGLRYAIAGTPSDHRSMLNCLSQLERMAGVRVTRTGKRRKSHKADQVSGFSIEAARREQAAYHRDAAEYAGADANHGLIVRRRELINELFDLVDQRELVGETGAARASTLLWLIRKAEHQMALAEVPHRPFDLHDLPVSAQALAEAEGQAQPVPKPDPAPAQLAARAREGKSVHALRAKVDDFDGGLLLPDTEPIRLTHQGTEYELFLSPANRDLVVGFLDDLVRGAKRVPRKYKVASRAAAQARPGVTPKKVDRDRSNLALAQVKAPEGEAKQMRQWLRENGWPNIADRGRFSTEQYRAYMSRNGKARRELRRAMGQ